MHLSGFGLWLRPLTVAGSLLMMQSSYSPQERVNINTDDLIDINTQRQTLLSAEEKPDFVAFVWPGLHQPSVFLSELIFGSA